MVKSEGLVEKQYVVKVNVVLLLLIQCKLRLLLLQGIKDHILTIILRGFQFDENVEESVDQ